jgi:hypothetical protein
VTSSPRTPTSKPTAMGAKGVSVITRRLSPHTKEGGGGSALCECRSGTREDEVGPAWPLLMKYEVNPLAWQIKNKRGNGGWSGGNMCCALRCLLAGS